MVICSSWRCDPLLQIRYSDIQIKSKTGYSQSAELDQKQQDMLKALEQANNVNPDSHNSGPSESQVDMLHALERANSK